MKQIRAARKGRYIQITRSPYNNGKQKGVDCVTVFFFVPQLHLRGSPFFFFCVPSYISGVHHSSSSAFPAISPGFNILLLLRSQLYLWGSTFFFFCVPSYISGVQHSSSSAFPAISLGFNILLLLRSQLYLWGSTFFFFCVPSYISRVQHSFSSSAFPSYISEVHHSSSCSSVFPSYISGVHHSSSSAFPAISLGFIILLLLLRSQLYLWGSPCWVRFLCM